MLSEFQAIIDRATGPSVDTIEADLRSVARLLLDRQFIFADDHGAQKRFDLVRRHKSYFEDLFDAIGFDLVVDDKERLVGILDKENVAPRTLKVIESMFLLALRVRYEESVKAFNLKEFGRADARLSDIWRLIEERTGRARPAQTKCREIVQAFQRNGIVRIVEELPEGDAELEIRPVIRLAMPEAALDALAAELVAAVRLLLDA